MAPTSSRNQFPKRPETDSLSSPPLHLWQQRQLQRAHQRDAITPNKQTELSKETNGLLKSNMDSTIQLNTIHPSRISSPGLNVSSWRKRQLGEKSEPTEITDADRIYMDGNERSKEDIENNCHYSQSHPTIESIQSNDKKLSVNDENKYESQSQENKRILTNKLNNNMSDSPDLSFSSPSIVRKRIAGIQKASPALSIQSKTSEHTRKRDRGTGERDGNQTMPVDDGQDHAKKTKKMALTSTKSAFATPRQTRDKYPFDPEQDKFQKSIQSLPFKLQDGEIHQNHNNAFIGHRKHDVSHKQRIVSTTEKNLSTEGVDGQSQSKIDAVFSDQSESKKGTHENNIISTPGVSRQTKWNMDFRTQKQMSSTLPRSNAVPPADMVVSDRPTKSHLNSVVTAIDIEAKVNDETKVLDSVMRGSRASRTTIKAKDDSNTASEKLEFKTYYAQDSGKKIGSGVLMKKDTSNIEINSFKSGISSLKEATGIQKSQANHEIKEQAIHVTDVTQNDVNPADVIRRRSQGSPYKNRTLRHKKLSSNKANEKTTIAIETKVTGEDDGLENNIIPVVSISCSGEDNPNQILSKIGSNFKDKQSFIGRQTGNLTGFRRPESQQLISIDKKDELKKASNCPDDKEMPSSLETEPDDVQKEQDNKSSRRKHGLHFMRSRSREKYSSSETVDIGLSNEISIESSKSFPRTLAPSNDSKEKIPQASLLHSRAEKEKIMSIMRNINNNKQSRAHLGSMADTDKDISRNELESNPSDNHYSTMDKDEQVKEILHMDSREPKVKEGISKACHVPVSRKNALALSSTKPEARSKESFSKVNSSMFPEKEAPELLSKQPESRPKKSTGLSNEWSQRSNLSSRISSILDTETPIASNIKRIHRHEEGKGESKQFFGEQIKGKTIDTEGEQGSNGKNISTKSQPCNERNCPRTNESRFLSARKKFDKSRNDRGYRISSLHPQAEKYCMGQLSNASEADDCQVQDRLEDLGKQHPDLQEKMCGGETRIGNDQHEFNDMNISNTPNFGLCSRLCADMENKHAHDVKTSFSSKRLGVTPEIRSCGNRRNPPFMTPQRNNDVTKEAKNGKAKALTDSSLARQKQVSLSTDSQDSSVATISKQLTSLETDYKHSNSPQVKGDNDVVESSPGVKFERSKESLGRYSSALKFHRERCQQRKSLQIIQRKLEDDYHRITDSHCDETFQGSVNVESIESRIRDVSCSIERNEAIQRINSGETTMCKNLGEDSFRLHNSRTDVLIGNMHPTAPQPPASLIKATTNSDTIINVRSSMSRDTKFDELSGDNESFGGMTTSSYSISKLRTQRSLFDNELPHDKVEIQHHHGDKYSVYQTNQGILTSVLDEELRNVEKIGKDKCLEKKSYDLFSKNILQPSVENKIYGEISNGFAVWYTYNVDKLPLNSEQQHPKKQFDSTYTRFEDANERAKFLFYWGNPLKLEPSQLISHSEYFIESSRKQCKWFSCRFRCNQASWKVAVVPFEVFEWLDHAES